jgi:hypothetical protein
MVKVPAGLDRQHYGTYYDFSGIRRTKKGAAESLALSSREQVRIAKNCKELRCCGPSQLQVPHATQWQDFRCQSYGDSCSGNHEGDSHPRKNWDIILKSVHFAPFSSQAAGPLQCHVDSMGRSRAPRAFYSPAGTRKQSLARRRRRLSSPASCSGTAASK